MILALVLHGHGSPNKRKSKRVKKEKKLESPLTPLLPGSSNRMYVCMYVDLVVDPEKYTTVHPPVPTKEKKKETDETDRSNRCTKRLTIL